MAAASKVGGKRKRQQSHSEQDKFLHKSSVLLQREAKKVRAFQVRKVVQQLKQSRAQLETAQKEHQELLGKQNSNGNNDEAKDNQNSDALNKKDKQVKKLQTTVNKLEGELVVFKALDLKAVVARAMETTGLEKKKQLEQQKKLQKQQEEQQKQESHYGGAHELDDESDDESDYGRERHLADESGDDDDGFDSEEYENARKTASAAGGRGGEDDSGSESESEDEQDEEEGAELMEQSEEQSREPKASEELKQHSEPSSDAASKDAADVPMEKPTEEQKEEAGNAANAKQNADLQLQNMLIDRILAHKQMKPLLEAIEKVLEKEERETEKKLRKQEKKALKRDRNEVLIGGRSSAAPTSLFLGSLSGRGGVIDDDLDGGVGMSSSYMDGAEDDIAEFLGEKKKKNRMGQNARRQKAIRMEEAAKRKQDRENGIFRPFGPRKEDALSKYGPSERPKKKKPAAEVQSKSKGSGRSSSKPEKEQRRGGGGGRERERERGAPPARSAGGAGASSTSSSRPPPVNAPPKVEPSHPSWIAKQALKEKEKASITAFSGKKIMFGDD